MHWLYFALHSYSNPQRIVLASWVLQFHTHSHIGLAHIAPLPKIQPDNRQSQHCISRIMLCFVYKSYRHMAVNKDNWLLVQMKVDCKINR